MFWYAGRESLSQKRCKFVDVLPVPINDKKIVADIFTCFTCYSNGLHMKRTQIDVMSMKFIVKNYYIILS